MRASTCRRRARGGRLALAMALGACNPETSLDQPAMPEATETGASSSEGTGSSSTGESTPSVLICDPQCTPLMLSTWSYEGPAGTRMVTQMVLDEDGSMVLGLQRTDGEVGLVKVSNEGQPQWAATVGLVDTPVELEDISLHPSGDILISATAARAVPPDPLTPTSALLARYDVQDQELAWVREVLLTTPLVDGVELRAGALAVLDEDVIVMTTVDGYSDGELLTLREYESDGSLRRQDVVIAQPGSGRGFTPLIAPSPTGEVITAHRLWDPEAMITRAATWRMIPPAYIPLTETQYDLALDELAVDSLGRRIELSHGRSSETVTLLLTSRRSSDLLRWEASLPVITSSDTRPTLAIGPDDDVYVATRATPRTNPNDPYVVLLEAARWSMDGELRWQARHPLDIMATFDPVELAIDSDDGLVVATVIRGRATIERYEQACACR